MSALKLKDFDYMFSDSQIAAIVMRQPLKPVEGDNATIYPPTYLNIDYNIDSIEDNSTPDTFNLSIDEKKRNLKLEKERSDKSPPNICVVDSVGSQANRMEPLFKQTPYSSLVPQISIVVKSKDIDTVVNILDAGHRIADAVVRNTELSGEIQEAFLDFKKGKGKKLAQLSPTSLVFGAWDSRGTGVKLPRVVRSTIRAQNVHPLKRSATYFPAVNYEKAGIGKGEGDKKASSEGLAGALNSGAPGGVLLDQNSTLIREAVLSLSALRAVRDEGDTETILLRRYILGLAFVAFTASQDALLRMGCELTGDPDNPATWEQVDCSGVREAFELSHEDALAYAQAAAKDFGVAESRTVKFDTKKAKESLKKK